MRREDFPIFTHRDIAYLDTAATSQKPRQVLDAMRHYYEFDCANTNRGAYRLGGDSTQRLEQSRAAVQQFIGAVHAEEILFTKSTTEALNIIASQYGDEQVQAGDEVALLISEHHANLLPWQRLCRKKGANLVYLYLNENIEFSEEEINRKIGPKTKIVACAMVSNALGLVNPVEKIIHRAHEVGARVVVDAAQSMAHIPLNVVDLDIDFLAFSAHKMYGPMGIGVLYGKKQLLEKMSPWMLGGDMVEYVYEQEATFSPLPNRMEAGTQNVAGAVGLSAAIGYLTAIGLPAVSEHSRQLGLYTENALADIDGLAVIGKQNPNRCGILSFTVAGIHPHDLASILDSENVCMRAGNHCAQPLLRYLNLNATTRISFGLYNTTQDIDRAIHAIKKAKEIFGKWT